MTPSTRICSKAGLNMEKFPRHGNGFVPLALITTGKLDGISNLGHGAGF